MKSPFKFLDAYTLADKEVFFGRAKESKALYQYVHATSLVLLYGLSGTGKTSLVQCGLSQRFDGPDWYPFFIRRGSNVNDSTREALTKALPKPTATDDLPTLVSAIFRHYFRPIYLIFDQFEELFTVRKTTTDEAESTDGPQKEQEQFFESINALLTRTEVPCKIILIMREEFIGQLYEYERIVPNLFDYRLRVEPMSAGTIQQVVHNTFQKFTITAEPTVTATITNNLLRGQATSQLAYLQVYLDRLWREAQVNPTKQARSETDPVHISQEALVLTGDVSNVLNRYLEEQEQYIQHRFDLADNSITNILDFFVTAEGTKQPIRYQLLNNQLLVSKIEVAGLTEALLNNCLLELEKARLIRRDDSFLELAHDSLAGIIDQKRTAEQRLINNLIQSFRVNYELYTRQGGFLNEQQVALYDQFHQKLLLDPSTVEYIEQSRTENQREADVLRQTNRSLKQQTRRLTGFIGAALVLVIVSFVLYNDARKAEALAKEGERRLSEAVNEEKQAKEATYKEALLARSASDSAESNLKKARREQANLFLIDAETYINSQDYQMAFTNIYNAESLLEKGDDHSLDAEIDKLKVKIKINLKH